MIEKNLSLDKIKYVKTLSDLEFKNFKQALFIITKSNFHRLKSNKARGILGALNVLNNTLAMMEKRGDYNS